MAKLELGEVEKIATLARIYLSSGEKDQLAVQLSSILDFVEKLQAIDTPDIEPTSQVTGLVDIWREDVVKPSAITKEDLLKNTPTTKDGYIVVKRVLK